MVHETLHLFLMNDEVEIIENSGTRLF